MMEMSEQIDKLAPAFVLAQGMIEGALKDSNNPHFKSKYADLSSVWIACKAALQSNGFAVQQWPGEMVDNRMTMTTMLIHSSGQWQRSMLSIPLTKVDAQGYGSCVTYARRYALSAITGVCPEDDDGNAASQPAKSVVTIDDGQMAELMILAEQGGADVRAFCTYFKIPSMKSLPADQFGRAREMLNKKLKEKTS
jgi:ERF superfamily